MYHFLPVVFLLLLSASGTHAQDPVSADEYSQRGITSFEKNNLEGAIADFTKAIELNGHQLEYCYYFRGVALYRRGHRDEAIADLSKAITLKQHPRFFSDRGNLLAQKGDLDGAVADLNRAIEIEPRYAKAYGDRGIVRLMRGEDAAAELDFRRCFELDTTLESRFRAAADHIKQEAVLRAEHKTPTDVEVIKFSWKEVRTRELSASSPAFPVRATPVSRTGLRVLGGAEKGEPGPMNQAGIDPFDPLSPTEPYSRTSALRGIDYKFVASIRNTGSKTITSVQWAYFLALPYPHEGSVYVFTTRINISPGKDKNLHDQVPSAVLRTRLREAADSRNRAPFKEHVEIVRLDYADGSSWRSSDGITKH